MELIHFNKAKQELQLATKIDEVKEIRDKAEALRAYSKQVGESLEMQNNIAEIKIRAERRGGELIRDMEKHPPGPPKIDRSHDVTEPPRLDELGIEKMQSHRWQQIASIPEERFENEVAKIKEGGEELTSARMLRVAKDELRKNIPEPNVEQPSGKYRILYADPPWQYNNAGLDEYGHAEHHYKTMSIAELCDIDIRSISEDDAILFMWVTSPFLEDCFVVINAWGFKYKTSFVWDKIDHNFGHYNSVRHEFLLVCTRGSCTPDNLKLYDSVQSIQKTKKHSEKPEEFRDIIDTLYTRGNKIELFARKKTIGWDVWGAEI